MLLLPAKVTDRGPLELGGVAWARRHSSHVSSSTAADRGLALLLDTSRPRWSRTCEATNKGGTRLALLLPAVAVARRGSRSSCGGRGELDGRS